jgi:hypothetical protein
MEMLRRNAAVEQYPTGAIRTYRMRSSHRAFCIVLLAVGAFFLAAFWGGAISGTREATFLELLFPIGFLLLGGYLTARAFKNVITLSQTGIELRTLFDRSALPFDKIGGRRRYLDRGGEDTPSIWHLKLEPNDDRFPSVDFEETYYQLDDSFYAWFRALPDLDALDKVRPKTSNFGLV